jgi:hypothetical protein
MDSVSTNLQAWQRVWRDGIVPQLTTKGLQGLQKALEQDNPRLITGATTSPPPLQCMANEPVEACCPLSFALLDGKQPYAVSVGPLEERFAMACLEACELLGEPASIRYFLNWIDETPRQQMRQELLVEVKVALTLLVQEEPETPLARLLKESIRLAESSMPA